MKGLVDPGMNTHNVVSFHHNTLPPQEWVAGGELFHHLDLEGAFDEPTAMFYAANVLMALEFLHNKGIVYRDLKPENLLLDTQVRASQLVHYCINFQCSQSTRKAWPTLPCSFH